MLARVAYSLDHRSGFGGPQGYCHQWAAQYPEVFDQRDLELANHVTNTANYHFFEWLAAIQIHQSTGYLSLIEKWGQKNAHKRKYDLVNQLFDLSCFLLEGPRFGLSFALKGPDLVVYKPDLSDYFFVECKGGKDKLSPEQIQSFQILQQYSGKPVYLYEFYPL